MIKGIVEIEKYGKVDTICQSVYNFEFKISKGFTGKLEDTLELMKLCKEEAEGYSVVKKMESKEDLFHLILSKP